MCMQQNGKWLFGNTAGQVFYLKGFKEKEILDMKRHTVK